MVVCLAALVQACKDQDSIYKEFIIANGRTYPQKADSLKILTGYERVRLQWRKAVDPTVISARVYWNNYTDSLDINLADYPDTVHVDIAGLGRDNDYTFYVVTFDQDGNRSIPVEISGGPYSDAYIQNCYDRTYKEVTRDKDYMGTILFGSKTTDLLYTEVEYMTMSGAVDTVRIYPDQMSVSCPDVKPGEYFHFRSVFKPKDGMDEIFHDWQLSTDAFPILIMCPRDGWIADSRNGYHPWKDGGDINQGGGSPAMVLDGNINTGWHSKANPLAPLPQVLTVDMLQETNVAKLVIKFHLDATKGRYIKDVVVYLSDTELPAEEPDETWPLPVASAQYDGTSPSFEILLPEGSAGRYLALVFPNSTTRTYINFMELEVYN